MNDLFTQAKANGLYTPGVVTPDSAIVNANIVDQASAEAAVNSYRDTLNHFITNQNNKIANSTTSIISNPANIVAGSVSGVTGGATG